MAYRPAEQKRYAALRAQGAANERRGSQFKHGGGPDKTASRRELSDEELFGEELSDEELFSDGAPIDDRSEAEKGAGWAINILDTITPSWGDEIVASPAAIWGGYDKEQQKARRIQERYRQLEPWDSGRNLGSSALGLVGGLAPASKIYQGVRAIPRAFTGGAAAKSALGRGAQSAVGLFGTGATYAGVNEAGQAQGGLPERYAAMQEAGVDPLLIGGLLGVAAGGVGSGIAGTGRVIGNVVRGTVAPNRQAARYLAEKLGDAGKTADDLAEDYARAAGTGKPVVLADVGPQGVKDAGGAAARTPGPGREIAQQTIGQRQEGQVARVTEDLTKASGGKPGSFTKTVEELTEQRAAEAKPLYEKAMHGKPLVSKKIVEVTNRPSGKSAMQRGMKIAQDEGIPESELVVRDSAGNVTGYTTKALHYMKLGLDDMIESAKRTGDNSAARSLQMLKRELLSEMDRLNPAYAQARKVFAGHSANKNALEQGRAAANPGTHPDQIKSDLAGLSEGEREFYRRGFTQRLIEQIESTPDQGNTIRRIFGNTAKRERLRAILGDDEYNRLAQRFGVEDEMYGTFQRANIGSETAERTAAQADIEAFSVGQSPQVAQGMLASFISGTLAPLWRQLGADGIARLLRGLPIRVRAEIAKMLFSSDPKQVRIALQAIAKEYKSVQAAKAQTDAAIAGLASTDEGKTAGGIAATAAYGYSPVQPF